MSSSPSALDKLEKPGFSMLFFAAGLQPLFLCFAAGAGSLLYSFIAPRRTFLLALGCILFACALLLSLLRRHALGDVLFRRVLEYEGHLAKCTTLRGYTKLQLDSGESFHLLFGPLRERDISPGKAVAFTYLSHSRIIVRFIHSYPTHKRPVPPT